VILALLALQAVDTFVFKVAMDEVGEKRQKLMALQLTEAEWSRVNLFLNLLAVQFFICSLSLLTPQQHAEECQHKFSSDLKSTPHLALPALESLHAGWTKCAADPQYSHFADALEQALEKVDEYYQKTSNSNAYMFAMGILLNALSILSLITLQFWIPLKSFRTSKNIGRRTFKNKLSRIWRKQ
jgi:hypothetical protein